MSEYGANIFFRNDTGYIAIGLIAHKLLRTETADIIPGTILSHGTLRGNGWNKLVHPRPCCCFRRRSAWPRERLRHLPEMAVLYTNTKIARIRSWFDGNG